MTPPAGTGTSRSGFTATVAPGVSLSGASVAFGDQEVGSTNGPPAVTPSHTGTATITSIVAGGDYAQTNTCGNSVTTESTYTIDVTFTHRDRGRMGSATITDSTSDGPQGIRLSGTGFATGVAVTFENEIGPSSAATNVVVVNTGTIASTVQANQGGSPRPPVLRPGGDQSGRPKRAAGGRIHRGSMMLADKFREVG